MAYCTKTKSTYYEIEIQPLFIYSITRNLYC